MRILHILSNFRWTERAEPAADLAIAQRQLGHTVHFLCGRNQGAAPEDTIEGRLPLKGLDHEELELEKHFRFWSACRDLSPLRRLILDRAPDIVHCHMPNAHFLAALALKGVRRRPLIVRTMYRPEGPEWPLRYLLLCRPCTDGVIVLSEAVKRQARGKFRRHPERVAAILPGIELDQFAMNEHVPPLPEVDLPAGAVVAGVVTAIGAPRKLHFALEAVARLAPDYPQFRLMIVGRGKVDRFVREPAQRLGISDRVILPGYCRYERLAQAYRTMDIFLYTFPGTDKSCRAVREALTSGLPVVAPRVGALPELVRDGETGLLTPLSAEGFAAALQALLRDPERRLAMGRAAAVDARDRFCRLRQARKVIAFYERLCAERGAVAAAVPCAMG